MWKELKSQFEEMLHLHLHAAVWFMTGTKIDSIFNEDRQLYSVSDFSFFNLNKNFEIKEKLKCIRVIQEDTSKVFLLDILVFLSWIVILLYQGSDV